MKYQGKYLITSEIIHCLNNEYSLYKIVEDLMSATLRSTPFLFEDVKLWWQFEVITRARHEVKVPQLEGFKLLYEQSEYSPLYGGTLVRKYKGIPTIEALKSLSYNSEVKLILTIIKDE